jgi:uncharacterized protein DUF5919
MATEALDADEGVTLPEPGPAARAGTVLAMLLEERGWRRFRAFQSEYEKAARKLDPALVHSVPSRAQWHRWMAGDLRRLPYVDHCRVLETMLPGWTAEELLSPADSVVVARSREQRVAADQPPPVGGLGNHDDGDTPHADVTAIFASRTEFIANVSPLDLFDKASSIRAAGLSLNMLCQQFADQRLRHIVENGAHIHALFLNPDGDAIRTREAEEGIAAGHLSALTTLNIDLLRRVRSELGADHAGSIEVAVYDEPIRFNITLIDDVCVAQPYLPAMRGVDSPTLLINRRPEQPGLWDTFERVFNWLAERSTPL